MSPVDFKKRQRRSVEFRGQGAIIVWHSNVGAPPDGNSYTAPILRPLLIYTQTTGSQVVTVSVVVPPCSNDLWIW